MNDEEDTQLLPTVDISQIEKKLTNPVLSVFITASSIELRTFNEFWNKMSISSRIKHIQVERRRIQKLRDSCIEIETKVKTGFYLKVTL